MNFGDPVIYVEKGAEHSATVMLVSNSDAAAGKDGEPSIGLAFFKKPFVPEYRYDVRHQSFNDKGAYWKDAASLPAVAVAVATVETSDGNPAEPEANSGSADEAKE